MNDVLAETWKWVFQPLLRRPRRRQVAAICWRRSKGEIEVLLITSRGRRRWILPKGWPIPGRSDPQSAATEAWEEAGVVAKKIGREPVGRYVYVKHPTGTGRGLPEPIDVTVFSLQVDKTVGSYPEAGQRRRMWVSPKRAAALVAEPDLRAILRSL